MNLLAEFAVLDGFAVLARERYENIRALDVPVNDVHAVQVSDARHDIQSISPAITESINNKKIAVKLNFLSAITV